MNTVRIAFCPLNDAALIILAEALGFYTSEGLDVSLSREANWSSIRDKLAYGLIDAAHLLAPMPIASQLGLGPSMGKIIVPMALGLNGNSFVVSSSLKARLEAKKTDAVTKTLSKASSLISSGTILAHEVQRRKSEGAGRITLAIPFTYSAHHFVLRHWTAAAGLDPERHIQWVVLPPSRMADMLASEVIDGFYSGAPWPQAAQIKGGGEILFSDPDYWSLKPEKVLGVRAKWADANPEATLGLLRALLKAALWARDKTNRSELAIIISQHKYLNAPVTAVEGAMSDADDGLRMGSGLIFDPEMATFPWISHAKWFLGQFVKWELTHNQHDFEALATGLYRPDLWRLAAQGLLTQDIALNIPLYDDKNEGGRILDWTLPASPNPIQMPPNMFFDGGIFTCTNENKA